MFDGQFPDVEILQDDKVKSPYLQTAITPFSTKSPKLFHLQSLKFNDSDPTAHTQFPHDKIPLQFMETHDFIETPLSTKQKCDMKRCLIMARHLKQKYKKEIKQTRREEMCVWERHHHSSLM